VRNHKKSAYLVFSAVIDQLAVQRFFAILATATQEGYNDVHLLMQTMGGNIPDGICLYNFFQSLEPIELSVYNEGNISSAGVIAYLGGDRRLVSSTGAFMIHRSSATFQGANSDAVQARVASLVIDDERNEAILKSHIVLTPEQWAVHKSSDLWLNADQAITAKVAEGKANFWVPIGAQVVNVFPWFFARTNPWDQPSIPQHGEANDSVLFEWVGRLISQWEHVEFNLSRLYTVFAGNPDDGETLREYGKGTIFRERLRGLRECANRYFIVNPDQYLESEFDAICIAAEGFSGRRNEVAHGVSFPTRLLPFFRDRNARKDRWAITPPYFALRNFDQGGYAKYGYTSIELNQLVLRMGALLIRVGTFRDAMLKARELAPKLP
jgi:ATP-dependent Clp protease protease subunit